MGLQYVTGRVELIGGGGGAAYGIHDEIKGFIFHYHKKISPKSYRFPEKSSH